MDNYYSLVRKLNPTQDELNNFNKHYYYVSSKTGLAYVFSFHAKCRMVERWRTWDINTCFSEFVKTLIRDDVDDIIACMDYGEQIALRLLETGQIFVITTDESTQGDLMVLLKTVHLEENGKIFATTSTPMYNVTKDFICKAE